MIDFWDNRYSQAAFAYGEQPNCFFKEVLDSMLPGRILLPAEGEGRNAVYAAGRGWKVDAFDQSAQGREKAMQLADRAGVSFSYTVGNHVSFPPESFDAIAFIYTHVPLEIKRSFHNGLLSLLKSGGFVILEGFSKRQRIHQQENPKAGGPRESAMLYSVEEIKELFPELETISLVESDIVLSEGLYHQGEASVIRYVGRKK